jgi:carbon monoxide dehydrogenase subunit G
VDPDAVRVRRHDAETEDGTVTYTRSFHIEAQVGTVFDLFADPNNFREVAPEGVDYTDVHVTQEGIGTHYTWSAKLAGLPFDGFDVFTEFVPDERIVDWSSSPLEGTWTYRFEPEGSGTRLSVENRTRSLWAVGPLGTLMDRLTARTHDSVFERLKASLEAQASSQD